MEFRLQICVGFLLLFWVSVVAQSNSEWTDHFSYRDCKRLVDTKDFIYVSTSVGLFVYDKSTSAFVKKSKINGLSDVMVTAISALPDNGLVVGYANGNIDVVLYDEVINIPELKDKQMKGGKRINDLHYYNGMIYCSVDFGVVLVNLEKYEIADTYYLGINSTNLKVNQIVVEGDNIYAATERGLLLADVNDPQIAYYESWEEISGNSYEIVAVDSFRGELIIVRKRDSNPFEIFVGNEYNWQSFHSSNSFKSINVVDSEFVLNELTKVSRYDSNLELIESFDNYLIEEELVERINVNDGVYSISDQKYYIGDKHYGLVLKEGNLDVSIVPEGPYSNNNFRLLGTPQGVYVSGGGVSNEFGNLNRNIEISFFSNDTWSHFWHKRIGDEDHWRDAFNFCLSSTNNSDVYMSSWGSGLFHLDEASVLNHYDQFNSGLENIEGASDSYVRVGGLASDSKGNIWMSNSEVSTGIKVLEDGDSNQWQKFSYETMNGHHSTKQILITKDDYVFVIFPTPFLGRQGLLVIDPKGSLLDDSDDVYKGPIHPSRENDKRNVGQLKLWDDSAQEITRKIHCLAEDKNGYIWIGTDNGVLLYYRPWIIFEEDYPVASRIKVPRNDGSNEADYLLDNEEVSCIAVDGADRKWIGTLNNGLYHVSSDGLKTYHSFNMDNSPLPSNQIISLAVDPISGDVFIGTDKGLVSFKGKASEGAANFNKIYAYPNPVRNDFNGDITITGLVRNSNVKITTVSGKLVYETISLGGKAYWNGTNFSGEKVNSGVYIIYVSSEDGLQVETTKILIVR